MFLVVEMVALGAAAALQGQDLGDGMVYRVIAQVQRRHFDPPIMTAGAVGTLMPISPPGQEPSMIRIFFATAVLTMITMITLTATAQPTPQPKIGACPSGYRDSGGYCAPTSDRAPAAVPKGGHARPTGCNRAPTALRCDGTEPRVTQGGSRPRRRGPMTTACCCVPALSNLPAIARREAAQQPRLAARDQARRFRVIARKDGDRVRLFSRPGNDLTDRFPLIVEGLARLRPRSRDAAYEAS